MTCLNCGKILTDKQRKKKNIFCSKGSATSYRQVTHDPNCEETLPKETLWYTSASKIFLEQIQSILNNNNIDCNIIKDCRKDCYYLKVYKKEHIKQFFNYIYNNSTICLQRKYQFFCNEIV